MKKMKNLFLVAVATFLLLGTNSASAITKAELQKKLTQSYTLNNGATIRANGDQIAQIERYLNQNNLTPKEMEVISKNVDAAINVLKSGTATKIEDLTAEQKSSIKDLMDNVSNGTRVKLEPGKNGEVTVYNIDGTEFSKITKNAVKYTNDNSVLVLASSISILGILVIANKMKKVNA